LEVYAVIKTCLVESEIIFIGKSSRRIKCAVSEGIYSLYKPMATDWVFGNS